MSLTPFHAILLVPERGDPTELLTSGPFGARPPILTWCYPELTEGPDLWCEPSENYRPHEPLRRAVVLAYNGKPFEDGCFRVAKNFLGTPNSIDGRPARTCWNGVTWGEGKHQEGIHLSILPMEPGGGTVDSVGIYSLSSWNHETQGDLPELLNAPEGDLREAWMLATAFVSRFGGEVVTL